MMTHASSLCHVCLSDGKSPLPINESSPGLIQTTKILWNLKMQDICNTKEDWRLLGLLLNVETINPEINPDYHQYFNIQGVEIDHEIPSVECLVNYLKRFPAELIALTNQTIWTNLRRYFVLDSYVIDEDQNFQNNENDSLAKMDIYPTAKGNSDLVPHITCASRGV
jgi:hypothetical protein